MADKTGKTKPRRLSKSKRTHRRRLKQAARKPGRFWQLINPCVGTQEAMDEQWIYGGPVAPGAWTDEKVVGQAH